MKNLKMLFCIVVFSVIGFLGCDDSASSNEPDENASVDSSSSVCKDCDDESSSSAKKIDSSAEKNVESSDDAEAGKSSSSKGRVISSSSEYTILSNASSSNDNALETCSEEFEGMVRIRKDSSGTQLKWDCTDGFWILRSSSSAASSSNYFDTTKVFNPDVEYGSHTDSRDGRVYRTVTISLKFEKPDGRKTITVFAENLNYGKMITGENTQSDSTKFCFDDDPWYCEHGFGGFYTWSNAMKFPSACDSVSLGSENCPSVFTDYTEELLVSGEDVAALYYKHQGICDDGWHIMNAGEWGSLAEINNGGSFFNMFGSAALPYGGHLLSANSSGFSLLPTGLYDFSKKQYKDKDDYAYHWLPQENGPTTAKYFSVSYLDYNKSFGRLKGGYALPIRCVKDY